MEPSSQVTDVALLVKIRAALLNIVTRHSCCDVRSVDAVGIAAHLVLEIDEALNIETAAIEKAPQGARQ